MAVDHFDCSADTNQLSCRKGRHVLQEARNELKQGLDKKRLPMGPGHVVSFSLRRVRSSESEFLPCQHKSPLSGKQAIRG